MSVRHVGAAKKKRAGASKARATLRRTHERRASYRAPRWKIPNVTPIGSDEPVSKTLPRAVKRIAETLHPEKIILFGSYAYGNPTPDSDVDLLVVMKTDASSRDRSWAVSRLMIPRPFAVDILVRTPKEIRQERTKGNFFVEEIYSQGIILYERPQRPSKSAIIYESCFE